MGRRRFLESTFKAVTAASAAAILVVLVGILWIIVAKGLPTLSWAMLTQLPKGDFYLGGGGGIANAIVGSIYVGLGATLLALVISVPAALYLRVFVNGKRIASIIRGALDVLWGVPSIVVGAFGFVIMVYMGWKASLIAGIVTVAILELPIMIRAIDEVARMVPHELDDTAYSLGSNKFETAVRVIGRQILPGVATGALLAFGRGVGDAASVLFTTNFTSRVPHSLFDSAATLPVAIFLQLNSNIESVRVRAYGAALVLVILVLSVSVLSRVLSNRLGRYIIK